MSTNQTRRAYPTDLNDNEWNVIAPLMPQPKSTGRPRLHAWREVLNAIFYVVKNGCLWKALPHDFPPWKSVYHYTTSGCGLSTAGGSGSTQLCENSCGRRRAATSSQAPP